jgi:RNA polymerase sigma-70 factor (ECF subfamily)
VAIDVEAYYRRYGPMVIRRCRQMLGNEEKAMEAAQDVFVQLVRRQDRLTDTAPAGLLMRMATNVCLNILRSEKRHPTESDDSALMQIATARNEEAGVFARLRLDRIFRREDPSTRTIAVLHYHDGLTLEETARVVGMSVSGVRKRLRLLRVRAQQLEGA